MRRIINIEEYLHEDDSLRYMISFDDGSIQASASYPDEDALKSL